MIGIKSYGPIPTLGIKLMKAAATLGVKHYLRRRAEEGLSKLGNTVKGMIYNTSNSNESQNEPRLHTEFKPKITHITNSSIEKHRKHKSDDQDKNFH